MNILKTLNTSTLFKGCSATIGGMFYEFTFDGECLLTVATILNVGCNSVSHFSGGKYYDHGNFIVIRHANKLYIQGG